MIDYDINMFYTNKLIDLKLNVSYYKNFKNFKSRFSLSYL